MGSSMGETSADAVLRKVAREQLLGFIRGVGTDDEDRTLEQVLGFDDQLWNCCHNHIQWVFPTDKSSHFNSFAPTLDEPALLLFRSESVIQQNLRRCLKRFLSFMGLTLEDGNTGAEGQIRICKAANFDSRVLMCWKGPNNHNWMRLSRVLQCLDLVGMEKEKFALYTCLLELVRDHPGMVEESTVEIWAERAKVDPSTVTIAEVL